MSNFTFGSKFFGFLKMQACKSNLGLLELMAKLFCNLELRVKNYEDPNTFPTFYQLVKKEIKGESKKQRLDHGDMEKMRLDSLS
jgi:hypothetical protein